MMISFHCPACSHRLKVPDTSAGRRGKCPACGEPVDVPFATVDDSGTFPVTAPAAATSSAAPIPVARAAPAVAVAVATPPAPANGRPAAAPAVPEPDEGPVPLWKRPGYVPGAGAGPTRVIVVDFEMPFASMVGFMVKWTLAAIPAMLILVAIAGFGSLAVGMILAWLTRR